MKIDNRQKTLAIAAMIAVGLLAGDKLIFTPLTGLWKEHSKRIVELRDNLESGQGLLAREQSTRDRWDKLQKSALPTDGSDTESKVLAAVERWTRDAGIGGYTSRQQWKENADNYKTLDCRVDVAGDIESLMRFLDQLERDPMAVRVEDLELTARDEGGRQLSLGVRFSALVLTGDQG